MKIVIHIGVHKTGTTFLQAVLTRNMSQLYERGVFYRPYGQGQTSHYGIVRKFSNEEIDIKGGQELLRSHVDEARASGVHTLLLSSEMLCEQRVDIDPFLSVLSPYEISTIAYMRRPDDLVVSAYNQIVRDEYHRRVMPLSEKNKAYDPSYKLILSRWMRSDLNLVLAPYDQKQWFGGSIFTDFLSMIGLEDTSGLDLSNVDDEVNTSLPASLIDVLLRANRIKMSSEDHKSFVRSLYELYRERPDSFLSYDILSAEQRLALRRELIDIIHIYRPFFRPGFDEAFLAGT